MKLHTTKPIKFIGTCLTNLLVVGVVFMPLAMTVHAFWPAKDTSRAGVVETMVVPSFQTRAIDTNRLQPFSQPIISVTFDNGWRSVYDTALPLLQRYGIRTTQYVVPATFTYPDYMSKEHIISLQRAGHEIGAHTMTHADLAKLDHAKTVEELTVSKAALSDIAKIRDFAAPYGSFNQENVASIKQLYRSNRGSDTERTFDVNHHIMTLQNFDSYNLHAYVVTQETSLDEIRELTRSVMKRKGWLILVYHQVDARNSYAVSPEALEAQLKFLHESPVRIAPVGAVLDAIYDPPTAEY